MEADFNIVLGDFEDFGVEPCMPEKHPTLVGPVEKAENS
jgi:hypothetical protein